MNGQTFDIKNYMNKEEMILYNKYKDIIPFPIIKFANDLGYDIYTFKVTEENKGTSGVVNYKTKQILINPNENELRQNFTIAHEIGHILLNKNNNVELHEDFRDNKTTGENEILANKIAGMLLMPNSTFEKLWNIHNGDVEFLSNAFNVSQKAITVKAIQLKLINNDIF